MEIGTGVFLSAMFLGTVALYIVTKDRWDWKKVILKAVLGILCAALIGAGGIYIYTRLGDRPHIESAMWDIQLGESQDEVKFRKGAATNNESDRWMYELKEDNGGTYVIGFKDGRVKHIFHFGDRSSHPSIQGVSGYSTMASITGKFGVPSKVTSSEDGLTKIVQFSDFRVWFGVTKDGVEAMGVYDPALWEPILKSTD